MERYVVDPDPEPPITRMFKHCILNAVKEHADQIKVETTEENTAVCFHIDEQWHEVMTLPTLAHIPLLQWVKELTAIDQTAPAPQHGIINLKVNQQDYDAQVNITPGEHGEILTLKLTQVA